MHRYEDEGRRSVSFSQPVAQDTLSPPPHVPNTIVQYGKYFVQRCENVITYVFSWQSLYLIHSQLLS
jgi:hypothetical protein